MKGNSILAFGVSPKWVKSNKRRKRERKREREERAKVGNNNGQYNPLKPEAILGLR